MLRHSKSVMSMTFMCIGIAKLECQISLGISFLSLISPCMIYLKEKYVKKKSKPKKLKKKFENLKNTKIVCVLCTLVLVYLGWPLKQSFLNFVSFVT